MRDATHYAEQVVAGNIVACKWVQLACERQLKDRDLERKGGQWKFDEQKASRICDFVERLPHVEGKWDTKNIVLQPWQCFILTTLFGWEDDQHNRRFRKALSVIPRKSSKTTLAAVVALYLLSVDNELGAQVYSAAKTREQARISWEIAKRMVEHSPGMMSRFGLKPMAHSITRASVGSYYKPLSRDADSLEGLNVHGGIIDELHVHPDREVWDVIDNGIAARRQPLIFAISTEGDASAGIFVDQVRYIQSILNGHHKDDSYFGIYYGLDPEDDWTLEENWVKANPNLGVSVSLREMRDKFTEAKQLPSAQATFLTKRLNVRVGAGSSYFNMFAWRQLCHKPGLTLDSMKGNPCIITVDLASKSDLTSVIIVFRNGGHYYVFGKHYLPECAVETGMPNHEFYRSWRIMDRLIVTTGSRTDYGEVERDVLELRDRFKPQRIGIDPNYNGEHFRQNMESAGVTIVEVPHTIARFSEPMKDLASLIASGRVHHDGDPVLDWALGNVTTRVDAKGNVYPRKSHIDNKIDPAVALIGNMGEHMRVVEAPLSIYVTAPSM